MATQRFLEAKRLNLAAADRRKTSQSRRPMITSITVSPVLIGLMSILGCISMPPSGKAFQIWSLSWRNSCSVAVLPRADIRALLGCGAKYVTGASLTSKPPLLSTSTTSEANEHCSGSANSHLMYVNCGFNADVSSGMIFERDAVLIVLQPSLASVFRFNSETFLIL